ncbi:hypothetical protein ABEB36_010723 [Hypothenemus hampei]|uniref:histone acetyltransferase n=1 Tax=Hypothenemus hampei TaxID=57062 RepID=A0ABD1ECU6_HYPHA
MVPQSSLFFILFFIFIYSAMTAITDKKMDDLQTKDVTWMDGSVSIDLRNNLIEKLLHTIYPTSDPINLKDERMHVLVTYVKTIEQVICRRANSKSEYYHLLAEKMYEINKELEETKKRRIYKYKSLKS